MRAYSRFVRQPFSSIFKFIDPSCQQARQADIVDVVPVLKLAHILMVRIEQSPGIPGEAGR